MGHRALFLDRDGVINERRLLLVRRPDQFRFRPGVPEAIARATRAGWTVVVATNQWPVETGLISPANLEAIHALMTRGIEAAGGRFACIEVCTHRWGAVCDCKKPLPGMLVRAARRFDIDLSQSWMVGDQLKDVLAGRAAGCRTALVNPTRRAVATGAPAQADLVKPGLPEVVDALLAPAPLA